MSEKDLLKAWWVTFETGPKACVQAKESEALELATKLAGRKAVSLKVLPYPTTPRLNEVPYPGTTIVCPSFCHSPNQCAGRTACPMRFACSE